MRKVLAVIFAIELQLSLHLATCVEWWAARAARRCGKFSGNNSSALKSEENGPWGGGNDLD